MTMKQEKLRILAVEDNPADFRLLEEYLKEGLSGKFEITQAKALKEALKYSSAQKFDIILLDLDLPDSMGLNTLESVYSNNQSVPIIVLTGFSDEETGIRAVKKNAQDYLVKGQVQSGILIRSIRYAIERKHTEEALKKNEAMLSLSQEAANAGSWDWDLAANKPDWSKEFYKLCGLDPQKQKPSFKNWLKVVYPNDRKRIEAEINLALTKKENFLDVEYRIMHPKKGLRWINAKGEAFYDNQKKPVRMIGIIIDVTERKHTQQMLLEKEAEAAASQATASERQRLYSVLETLPAYVALLDKDHFIPFANKFFRERFGENFSGRRCHDYLFNRTTPCENCQTYKVMASKSSHHWEWSGPDGRNYDIYDYPFIDSDGSAMILEMGIDITDRKKAEKKLIEAQLELERAKRLSDIGTLASTVAHELRNPLASIALAASNIQRKANNPLLEKHLVTIGKKVFESDQIINNLLYYSRIKSPHYEMVNIYGIVKECVDAKRKQLRKKIYFKPRMKAAASVLIEADPVQMKEVFSNIIHNACDAVPDQNGKIEIAIIEEADRVKICISDNGCGIEKEYLNKVFDPFFTTKARGTGLGLSVCRQIVNLHGGSIYLESQLKKGTVVILDLPKKA